MGGLAWSEGMRATWVFFSIPLKDKNMHTKNYRNKKSETYLLCCLFMEYNWLENGLIGKIFYIKN